MTLSAPRSSPHKLPVLGPSPFTIRWLDLLQQLLLRIVSEHAVCLSRLPRTDNRVCVTSQLLPLFTTDRSFSRLTSLSSGCSSNSSSLQVWWLQRCSCKVRACERSIKKILLSQPANTWAGHIQQRRHPSKSPDELATLSSSPYLFFFSDYRSSCRACTNIPFCWTTPSKS